MSHLLWLDQEHLKRIRHLFPKPRGVKRANDRNVISGAARNAAFAFHLDNVV